MTDDTMVQRLERLGAIGQPRADSTRQQHESEPLGFMEPGHTTVAVPAAHGYLPGRSTDVGEVRGEPASATHLPCQGRVVDPHDVRDDLLAGVVVPGDRTGHRLGVVERLAGAHGHVAIDVDPLGVRGVVERDRCRPDPADLRDRR